MTDELEGEVVGGLADELVDLMLRRGMSKQRVRKTRYLISCETATID